MVKNYLMLLSYCKPMWYFLPPENFGKLIVFRSFQWVKREHSLREKCLNMEYFSGPYFAAFGLNMER